jgi:Uncharacterised protein family (UPF0236)
MSETREELQELAARLARELVAERFPDEPMTLEQMEEALAEVKRELGDRLQRAWIEQQEPKAENRATCSGCGGRARLLGARKRLLVTRHGECSFTRRYYHCSACREGFAPLDLRLGLDDHTTSPKVRVWAAELGAEGAFLQSLQRLTAFTDIRVSESTLARLAVEVGRRLRAAELAEAEQILAGQAAPRRTTWQPQRLYLSLDGAMAPLREPWKRDASLGKLQCRWGECKTAVCYETRLGSRGEPVVARRQYTATLEPVSIFERLVVALAYHCGGDGAKEKVVLADGLAYNWRIAEEHFPEAIQILDWYHASEHLHQVARVCLGEEGDMAKRWVMARQEELMCDQVAAVSRAIHSLPAPTPEAEAVRTETRGYLEHNIQRMRYGTFVKAGYQIASGVMEAACKTVVHQRLDQSGMHWRRETAEAIVALRANRLSDHPRALRPYCAGWS